MDMADGQKRRTAGGRATATRPRARVAGAPVGLTSPTDVKVPAKLEDVTQIIQRSQEAALRGLPAGVVPGPLVAPQAAQAADAAVTDELDKGGPAFGNFVKSVGLAVAEAQSALDDDLVRTAGTLSDAKIDVIAIFEQEIDDDGLMKEGTILKQKLPLINYLMPTAYQWTRVYLQADMNVSEFNSANGFNIQQSSSSFRAGASAGYSLFGGFQASGGVSYGSASSSVSGDFSSSRDLAAGSLHMEATLEPRTDVQLPKPFVIQKGPRLKLSVGGITDLPGGDPANPKTIGKQAVITAELTAQAGRPLKDKTLEIQVSEPKLNYTTGAPTTDAEGKLTITLQRKGAAFDNNAPPLTAVVRVWLGLVSQTVGITL